MPFVPAGGAALAGGALHPSRWQTTCSVRLIILLTLVGTLWGCKQKDPAAARRRAAQVKEQIGALMERARVEANRELFERAERMLSQAIKDAPNDDFFHVKLAMVLKERWYTLAHTRATNQYGRDAAQRPPARIKTLLNRALAINPRSPGAHRALADYFNAIDQPGEAIKTYQKLQKLNPDDLTVYLDMGSSHLLLKQPGKAKVYFHEVLTSKLAGRDVRLKQRALDGLARAAMLEGKVSDAEDYYLQAVAPGPLACSYHSLGQLYAGLGKFKKGARFVMKVAEMEPRRLDIQFRAAVFSFMAYDFKSARRYCDRVLSSSRKPGKARNVLGFLLLLERKYGAANKKFGEVLEGNPKDPGAAVGLGHLAIIKKDYGRAGPLLKPHAVFRPRGNDDQRSYAHLVFKMASLGMGWMLSNQGKHARAIKYYEGVLSKNAADLFSLLGKGSALNALGRLDEAAAVFKKVLVLDPGNQYGLAELGLVRLNKGDTEGAKAAFKKALARGDQKYTCPHEGLGLVFLKQGKIARARRSFEKAIAINPDIEYKKFNELAKIFIKQGEPHRAIKLLKKSIQNYPYDPEARQLLKKLLAVNR